MRVGASFAALCGLGLTLIGCRSLAPRTMQVVYADQPCWRLSNGAVDVVVNPDTGRIVRYGFVGQGNVLWENPRAREVAPRPGDWKNWGGDKVWLWPQAAWKAATGRVWPPPGDGNGSRYSVEPTRGGLRLTSTEVSGLGLRVVRDIGLAATGSRVTIRSRLEPVGPPPAAAWSAWTITQTAVPDLLLARLDPAVRQVTYPFAGHAPFPEARRFGSIVHLVPDFVKGCKDGLAADRLAGVFGNVLFIQTIVPDKTTTGVYVAGEKAQLCASSEADPRPSGVPPYVEMELTAPVVTLGAAGSELTVTWQLRRLTVSEREPAAVDRLVESL